MEEASRAETHFCNVGMVTGSGTKDVRRCTGKPLRGWM